MLRKILIGIAAVVLVLVIIIATRPATYRDRAEHADRRSAGRGVRAGERLPRLGRLVSLGEARIRR